MANKRAWAVVLVTAGLGLVLSLPAQGARPSLAQWEWGFTTTAVMGVLCIGLGAILFLQVGRTVRERLGRVQRIATLQAECRQLQERVEQQDHADVSQLRAEAEKWEAATYSWFQQQLPEVVETFRADHATRLPPTPMSSDAKDVWMRLEARGENLRAILAMSQLWGDE